MKNKDLGLLILRLAVGVLLLLHGINKLIHGVGGVEKILEGNSMPGMIAYGAYVGEVIAPLLIIIGYRTRIFSIFIIINMLVIIFVAKTGSILSLEKTGAWALELQGLYLFGAFALFFTGAGKYAASHKSKWD